MVNTDLPPEWPPRRPYSAPRHAQEPAWQSPVPARRPEYRPLQPVPRRRARRADASAWHWLLLVPIVLPLTPPIYNRIDPVLFGIPFFYWSQFAFAVLASLVITVVHLRTR